MSYKYFGKIAGSTLTRLYLDDITPEGKRSPFDAQSPGTKFLAYGEDALSRSMNRALGALSCNIDSLAAVLDAPALRTDVLHYLDDANTTEPTSTFGFPGLSIPDPDIIRVLGFPEVNLGDAGATSTEPPPTWLFVGTSGRALQGGKTLKLYRDSRSSKNNLTEDGGDSPRGTFANVVVPQYVKDNAAGSDIFANQNYIGDSPHSIPDSIPPIAPVATDLPPYGGSPVVRTIRSWDEDGPVLDGPTLWSDLHARPGCYVHITGANANNGLYLIRTYSDDKAILTRGGLTKVTVDNGAIFTAGQMVSWASPDNNAAGLAITARDYKAYVVYKNSNDLWLAPVVDIEDSSTGGSTGSRVASDAASGTGHIPTSGLGQFGLYDAETGADTSSLLTISTYLYPVDFTALGATSSSQVTALTPAGAVVSFDTGETGSATLCAPPGFLLNPVLGLPDITTNRWEVLSGNYNVSCRTMTTVREKLVSAGANPTLASAEEGEALLPDSDWDLAGQTVQGALLDIKYGSSPLTAIATNPAAVALNDWYSGTRNILGPDLWFIEAGDGTYGIGESYVAGEISTGDQLDLVHTNTYTTKGTVVTGWDDFLILTGVYRDVSSWALETIEDRTTTSSIVVGTTIAANDPTSTPTTFTVASYVAPTVDYLATELESAAWGLTDAYNRNSSSSHLEKGLGQGSTILMVQDRPITLILAEAASQIGIRFRTNQGANWDFSNETRDGSAQRYRFGQSASTPLFQSILSNIRFSDFSDTVGATLAWGTGALTFDDTNTGSAIPLSSATDTAIDASLPANIIGALNWNADKTDMWSDAFSAEVTGGCVTTNPGAPSNDITVATGTIIQRGKEFSTPVVNLVGVADGTHYYYWDDGNYPDAPLAGNLIDAADLSAWNSETDALVAKVVISGGVVTSLVDLRKPIRNLDKRVEILVGGNNVFQRTANRHTHFALLSDAVKWVNAVANSTSSTAVEDRRSYVIKVVSEVEEFSSRVPIVLEAPGVTIMSEATEECPIRWGSSNFDPLIDINGQDRITIKGLDFAYDHNADTATDGVVAITNTSGTSPDRLIVEDCRTRKLDTGRLHGFFRTVTGAPTNSRFTGNVIDAVSDYGFFFLLASATEDNTVIENNVITQDGAKVLAALAGGINAAAVAGQYGNWKISNNFISGFTYGIHTDVDEGSTIVDNRIENTDFYAILHASGDQVKIRGNTGTNIHTSAPSRPEKAGIVIETGADVVIESNVIDLAHTTLADYGIVVDPGGATITGNRCAESISTGNGSIATGNDCYNLVLGSSTAATGNRTVNDINAAAFADCCISSNYVGNDIIAQFDAVISGNRIEGDISLPTGARCVVSGNSADGSIVLGAGVTSAIVMANRTLGITDPSAVAHKDQSDVGIVGADYNTN